MCKAVRYIYPECGHPVDPDPKVWIVERCIPAISFNRDCWIPRNVPENFIEKKPWPNDNLTEPCYMSHQPAYSSATFEVMHAEMQDRHDSPSSATLSLQSKGHARVPSLTEEEIKSLQGEEEDYFTPVEVRFAGPIVLPDEAILRDLEPLYLDPDDHFVMDDIKLHEDDGINNVESTISHEIHVFTDEDIALYTQMIEQANEELAIASTEDNIEWAQVAAVDTSAPLDYFEESEDEDMDVKNLIWF
ncbi:uncharacterized protein BKA55DRAFT_684917 [Fusarium redolens]|uniref:Uncharacterized protein n=1 Tax=Fusarium redolens TaxID=48865 RepID=A0A9P9KSC9_FUSRE|nr:uncharacterized protein BKA55DRAFT_684917 [Fusarium redolens]KAH7267641.1 hypothetical protein BKA55DRAFT_684917 [Fusarium redolens]